MGKLQSEETELNPEREKHFLEKSNYDKTQKEDTVFMTSFS